MVSDKQREMLAFIETFIGEKGYPPTYEEIRVALDISSKSLVDYHLGVLESAELLTRSPNTPRGIRLQQQDKRVSVPLVAEAAPTHGSAPPALAEPNPEEVIELTCDIVPDRQNLYALKVQNGARLEALLNEGDILIMQPQTRAKNGELVAARLVDQNELTFRRYYRENGHVRLQPDNPTMEPVIVKPQAVQVQGKVVAVIRQEQ